MLTIQSFYQNLKMNYKVLLMEWKNIVQKINYRLMSTKAKSWYFLGGKIRNKPKISSCWKWSTNIHSTHVSLCHILKLSN